MIKLNEIPLDYEPRHKIMLELSKFGNNLELLILMNEVESAFLCGTLQTFRPKKILEVGVAAGGSTAIILQALENIGESYEMHSVDLATKVSGHDTGYLATIAKENNLLAPPSQPCGVNISFTWANTCRKSLTRSAATLIL